MTDFNELWAAILRMAIKQAKTITDDEEALKVQCLFKEWQEDKELNTGEYIRHNGKLYKVKNNHKADKNKKPKDEDDDEFENITNKKNKDNDKNKDK